MFKNNISTPTKLVFLLIVLNILDFWTTHYAMSRGAEEMNPLVNFLIAHTGSLWSVLWLKIVVLSVVIIPYYVIESKKNIWKSQRMTYMLMGLNAIFAYTVVSNSFRVYETMIMQA